MPPQLKREGDESPERVEMSFRQKNRETNLECQGLREDDSGRCSNEYSYTGMSTHEPELHKIVGVMLTKGVTDLCYFFLTPMHSMRSMHSPCLRIALFSPEQVPEFYLGPRGPGFKSPRPDEKGQF